MEFTSDGFTFVVDPVTLRDACTEPERLSAFCDAHLDAPLAVAYLRIVGRLDEAEERGRRVVEEAVDPLARSAALARLGHVLQWQERYPEALALFDKALACAGVDTRPPHEAQVRVHRAKCHLAAGDRSAAAADARTALTLLKGSDADGTAQSASMVLDLLADADAAPEPGGPTRP